MNDDTTYIKVFQTLLHSAFQQHGMDRHRFEWHLNPLTIEDVVPFGGGVHIELTENEKAFLTAAMRFMKADDFPKPALHTSDKVATIYGVRIVEDNRVERGIVELWVNGNPAYKVRPANNNTDNPHIIQLTAHESDLIIRIGAAYEAGDVDLAKSLEQKLSASLRPHMERNVPPFFRHPPEEGGAE